MLFRSKQADCKLLQNPCNMSKCLTKQSEKRIVQINSKEKTGSLLFFMEKGIRSSFIGRYESDIFGADNSGESAEHNETEDQERIEKLNAVLESPDSVEDLYVRSNSRYFNSFLFASSSRYTASDCVSKISVSSPSEPESESGRSRSLPNREAVSRIQTIIGCGTSKRE